MTANMTNKKDDTTIKRALTTVANLCESSEYMVITRNEVIYKNERFTRAGEGSWSRSQESIESVLIRVENYNKLKEEVEGKCDYSLIYDFKFYINNFFVIEFISTSKKK